MAADLIASEQAPILIGYKLQPDGSYSPIVHVDSEISVSNLSVGDIIITDPTATNKAGVTAGGAILTQVNAGTSGGWTPSSQTALSTTVQSIKSSAGQLGGLDIFNPNGVTAFIQFFNIVSGSVSLGSTTPTFVKAIPAGAAANINWGAGIAFNTAISWAATTTATGSTALGSALTGFALFA